MDKYAPLCVTFARQITAAQAKGAISADEAARLLGFLKLCAKRSFSAKGLAAFRNAVQPLGVPMTPTVGAVPRSAFAVITDQHTWRAKLTALGLPDAVVALAAPDPTDASSSEAAVFARAWEAVYPASVLGAEGEALSASALGTARAEEAEILDGIFGDLFTTTDDGATWRIRSQGGSYTLLLHFAPRCRYPLHPPLVLVESSDLALSVKRELVQSLAALAEGHVPEPFAYAAYTHAETELQFSSLLGGTSSTGKGDNEDGDGETHCAQTSDASPAAPADGGAAEAATGTVQELVMAVNALERKKLLLQSEAAFARTLLLANRKQLYTPTSAITTTAPTAPPQPQPAAQALTDELKYLKLVYSDACTAYPLELSEQFEGWTDAIKLVLRSSADPDGLWLALLVKFPELYPAAPLACSVLSSSGVTTGDLAMLDFILANAAEAKSSEGLLAGAAVIEAVVNFLGSVAQANDDAKIAAAQQHQALLQTFPADRDVRHVRTRRGIATTARSFEDVCCDVVDNLHAIFREQRRSDGKWFKLLSLENIASRHLLKQFHAKAKQLDAEYEGASQEVRAEHMAPVVCFHGSSRSNVDSIIASGVLAAGESTRDGTRIPMAHGALYGCGTYVSPLLDKASQYAFTDARDQQQVFVSLVLPGRVNFIAKRTPKEDWWKTDALTHHSRLSEFMEEMVLFDSAQVLPLFLATFNTAGACVMTEAAYADLTITALTRMAVAQSRRYGRQQKKDEASSKGSSAKDKPSTSWQELQASAKQAGGKARKEVERVLPFRTVPGTGGAWLSCSLTAEELQQRFPTHFAHQPRTHVSLVFVLDKSASLGSNFRNVVIPACAQIHAAVDPDVAHAVLFGATVTTIALKSALDFEDPALAATSLEDATDIAGGLRSAVDLAVRNKLKRDEQRQELRYARAVADYETYQADLIEQEGAQAKVQGQEAWVAKRLRELSHTAENDLTIFVFMSDGEDTVNSGATLDATIEDCGRVLTGNQAQTIFKVVAIGKNTDVSLAMKARRSLQTMAMWENSPIVYARRCATLSFIVQDLCEDLSNALNGTCIKLALPEYGATTIQQGFVTDILAHPAASVPLLLCPQRAVSVLFCGKLPDFLDLDGDSIPVKRIEATKKEQEGEFTVAAAVGSLRLIAALVANVKLAAVALRDHARLDSALTLLRSIVAAVKAESAEAVKTLSGLPPAERIARVKALRRVTNEVEHMLRSLLDSVRQAAVDMSADQQAQWLARTATMRYGAKALALANVASAANLAATLTAFSRVALPALERQPFDYAGCLSKRTTIDHLTDLWTNPPSHRAGLTDLLYAYGATGLQVRVRRSQASNVNPWYIHVEYVSDGFSDTHTAMCCLDTGVDHADAHGNAAPEVLVVIDPRNPRPYEVFLNLPLHAAYGAVVFTRNPALALPSQRQALLAVALVRSVTQLCDPGFQTAAHVQATLHVLYTLRAYLLANRHFKPCRCGHALPKENRDGLHAFDWRCVGQLLEPQPGTRLTESEDDVQSICRILAAVCALPDAVRSAAFFDPASAPALQEGCLALLAEAVSRDVRMQIRSLVGDSDERDIAMQLVGKALGIDPSTCVLAQLDGHPEPHDLDYDDSYNIDTAKSVSNRFFARSWSNCPPKAVMACMVFAEALGSFAVDCCLERHLATRVDADADPLVAHLLQAMRGATMASFARRFCGCHEEGSATKLQIALYVQAIHYHSSRVRKAGLLPLSDPERVIRAEAKAYRVHVYTKSLLAKLARERAALAADDRAQRKVRLLQEQEEFLAVHKGLPKVFNCQELEVLNRGRALDDLVELTESGLPRNHCAYPDCPLFLLRLQTAKDKALRKRHALFHHLKYFEVPVLLHVPALHASAKRLAARESSKAFVTKMRELVDHSRAGSNYTPQTLDDFFAQLWASYCP